MLANALGKRLCRAGKCQNGWKCPAGVRYRAESGAVLTDRELAAHEVAAVLYVMSDHLPPTNRMACD